MGRTPHDMNEETRMIPSTAPDFAKLVPGFDFLQGLVKNAGSVLPGIGQWVAPTLNPEELEKRIEELKTVQFWLEQNGRMLGATIQALEVQRMTLSTLQTMNVQMGDLRESMRIKLPEELTAPAPTAAAEPEPEAAKPARPRGGKSKAAPTAVVDPMQWWGALTKQFTQLAATAMKDAAADGAKGIAGDLVKQGFSAADQAIKAGMAPAQRAAKVAGGVANQVARSAQRAKAASVSRKPAAKRRVTVKA
jgi:hypothetical protein